MSSENAPPPPCQARVRVSVTTIQGGPWHLVITGPDGVPLVDLELCREKVSDPQETPVLFGSIPVPPGLSKEDAAGRARDIADLCSRFSRSQVQPGEIERVGRHLFESCLGVDAWRKMEEAARAWFTAQRRPNQSLLLELAVQVPPEDSDLQRLPWELLHTVHRQDEGGRDDFVSAGYLLQLVDGQPQRHVRVAVTRLVVPHGGKGEEVRLQLAGGGLRMLFVIGCSLNDSQIRPGSEFFNLMRRLQSKGAGTAMPYRVVLDATLEKLQDAVEDFGPDVVHFIGHGRVTNDQCCLLMRSTGGSGQPDEIMAGAFADALRDDSRDGRFPAVVVLSACSTAVAGGGVSGVSLGAAAAPFAAQLVAKRVPMVVGMAGRVTDLACRLFTRAFGEALVQGCPVVAALEVGRRAAFRTGEDPRLALDWSLPTLFVADGLPPNFALPKVTDESIPRVTLLRRLGYADLRPSLAGNFEQTFEPYREWLGPEKRVLVIYGPPGTGKSRLLREYAARAVLDGHFPLLITGPAGDAHAEGTCGGLRLKLRNVLERNTSGYSDAHPAFADKYARQLEKLSGWPDGPDLNQLPEDTDEEMVKLAKDEKERSTPGLLKDNPRLILLALRIDLYSIFAKAREFFKPATPDLPGLFRREDAQPLLLLDNLQVWDSTVLDALVSREQDLEVLGPQGLHVNKRQTLRVALAFRSEDRAWKTLADLTGRGGEGPYLVKQLEHWRGDEALAASLRALVDPPVSTKTKPASPRPPYLLNPAAKPEDRLKYRELLDDFCPRLPASFDESDFDKWTTVASKFKFLLDAKDDEKVWDALLKPDGS